MELEFDKEIDALLRKASTVPSVTTGAAIGSHLDADELSALAENAIPGPARQMYLMHLADCDICRKTLSGFISMNPEAASEAAISADLIPAIAVDIPWYKRMFAVPNLAYAMGGLVVIFSGIIGLLVWQSGLMGRNAEVSRISESSPTVNQSSANVTSATSNGLAAANTASNSNSSSSIESVTKSGVAVGTSNAAGESDRDQTPALADVAKNEPAAPSVAKPPPANEVVITQAEREVRTEKAKEDTKLTIDGVSAEEAKKRSDDQRVGAESSLKTRSAKELRVEGPRQVQTQTQGGTTAFSNLRTVGGRTFELRDGTWYDTGYAGQNKKDVKRGSDKYKKLDAGLRNIAEQLSGTIVVVWNGQAYKIK